MFLAFCALGVAWVYICVKERANIHAIHYLMFVLVLLRALTLFTEAGMYHYDQISGNPDGWNIAFYVFTFVRGIMFFTVVVLIGTGWSYLRPFIGEQEKKVLVVVIPLQVEDLSLLLFSFQFFLVLHPLVLNFSFFLSFFAPRCLPTLQS